MKDRERREEESTKQNREVSGKQERTKKGQRICAPTSVINIQSRFSRLEYNNLPYL